MVARRGGGVTGRTATGGRTGGCTGLPTTGGMPLTEVLPTEELPTPTTLTELPLMLTGTWTGSWSPLPDSSPGESFPRPSATAPRPGPLWPPFPAPFPAPGFEGCEGPDDPGPGWPGLPGFPPPWSALTHRFPAAELSTPTTLTVFPHTFTGACTGSCSRFPDSTPGERTACPPASASA